MRNGGTSATTGTANGSAMTTATGSYSSNSQSSVDGSSTSGNTSNTYSGNDHANEAGTTFYVSTGWEQGVLAANGVMARTGGSNYSASAQGNRTYGGNYDSKSVSVDNSSFNVTTTTTRTAGNDWNGQGHYTASASGNRSFVGSNYSAHEQSSLNASGQNTASSDETSKVVRVDSNASGTDSTDTASYSANTTSSFQSAASKVMDDSNGSVTRSESTGYSETGNTSTNTTSVEREIHAVSLS